MIYLVNNEKVVSFGYSEADLYIALQAYPTAIIMTSEEYYKKYPQPTTPTQGLATI